MRRQPSKRVRRAEEEERRALRILTGALRQFERLEDPDSVRPVESEPDWVARLPANGRAFTRLLLLEASRSPVRKRRG